MHIRGRIVTDRNATHEKRIRVGRRLDHLQVSRSQFIISLPVCPVGSQSNFLSHTHTLPLKPSPVLCPMISEPLLAPTSDGVDSTGINGFRERKETTVSSELVMTPVSYFDKLHLHDSHAVKVYGTVNDDV